MKRLRACVLLGLITGPAMTGVVQGGDATSPLVAIASLRLVRPDEQVDQINRWFSQSTGKAPAGVLAAWKQASLEGASLGKPLEALITSFNPEMAAEWKALDDSVLTLWGSRESTAPDALEWSFVIPKDDGSIAAFVLAARITDGDSEPRLEDPSFQQPVERLGPIGAPLALRIGKTIVVASSRKSLSKAVRALDGPIHEAHDTLNSSVDSRPGGRVHPSGVRFEANSLTFQAIVRKIQGRGVVLGKDLEKTLEGIKIEGTLAVERDSAAVRYRTTGPAGVARHLITPPSIDPEWLDWVPRSETLAALVLGIDPSPSTWNAVFGFLDKIEKSDPAKARMMPVRTRLNSLLAVARVQPEVDFWPRLKGLTVSVFSDCAENLDSIASLLAIHTESELAASSICETMLPRITATYLQKPKPALNNQAARASAPLDVLPPRFRLENVRGKPLIVTRRGATVLLGWGKTAESRLSSLVKGQDVVGRSVGTTPGRKDVSRLGLFWPTRYGLRRRNTKLGTEVRRVLEDAPPIVWFGGSNAEKTQIDDLIVWNGIQPLVQRLLNVVPMSEPLPR